MTYLLLTVRFSDERYHGLLGRGGLPEWPPSPFRLFQALLAGVARRDELVVGEDLPENKNFTAIGQALGWLQRHTNARPPIIIAPKSKTGQAITRFVPNNDGDKRFDRQERLSAKPTIPTLFLLEPDQKPEVHYVWDITDVEACPIAAIERAARSLTVLGWGIDMAFADARLADGAELQQLKGIRWYPKKNAGTFRDTLRTPTYDDSTGECTLCDLRRCHSTFVNRIEHGKPLKTVDKPKVFERVLYTSIERPIGRPCRLFTLVDEDDDIVAYSQSKFIHIAGMVKHLAIERMKRNPPHDLRGRTKQNWIEQYIAGHQSPEDKAAKASHSQLTFAPLQSLGHEHADPAVRRVMIVAPLGDEAWLKHIASQLDGQLLKPLPNTPFPPGTRLELIDETKKDGVRDRYLRSSRTWASVTPVILPGHDDHKPDKRRRLIEKALAQSSIDQPCEYEWSVFSHFRTMLSAHKYIRDEKAEGGKRRIGYIRPDHLLEQSAVHLKLTFEHAVPGPITIGAGRFCGFGLFAAVND